VSPVHYIAILLLPLATVYLFDAMDLNLILNNRGGGSGKAELERRRSVGAVRFRVSDSEVPVR
jgi:hypothetical protein